jgi:hypothetical protein
VSRRIVRAAVAVAVAFALGVTGLGAAQPASADTAPRRIVNGWLPYYAVTDAKNAALDNAELWGDAMPFWYNATGATTISGYSGAGDQSVVMALRGKGIKVIPTVVEAMDGPAMAPLLSDAAQRAAHVSALVNLVTANGYDGIDLDYENMNFNGSQAVVRAGFVALTKELSVALHAQGKLLSITVGPRTSATDPNWAVFDYAGLGPWADRFRVMTYDYHYKNSVPGAVAPIASVEKAIAYARSVVTSTKIDVGVPMYGYDWPADATQPDGWGTAAVVSYQSALALQKQYGISAPSYSTADQAPYFSYRTASGVNHTVWYNDVNSTRSKMSLIGKYNLHGLVFWTVGKTTDDQRQWPMLKQYAVQYTSKVSITAPAAVTYGTAQKVTGKLTTASGAAIAGTPVALQFQAPGATTWRTVARGTSSSTGAVSLKWASPSNGKFRLYAYATWTYTASTSPAVATAIRWKATAAFARKTVKRNKTIKLSGKVTPARAGAVVQRQRYIGGKWTTVASTKVTSAGAYSFSFKLASPNTYTFRVYVPATKDNASATSPTVKVKVT